MPDRRRGPRLIFGRLRGLLGSKLEPRQLARTFHIATSELVTPGLVDDLVGKVAAVAPAVTLVFHERSAALVDLALVEATATPDEHDSEKLFDDRFVCVGPRDLVKAKTPLSIAAFTSVPHLAVSQRGVTRALVDDELAKVDAERRVLAIVPSYTDALRIARRLRSIVVAPERFVRRGLATNLRAAPLPFVSPKVEVVQSWPRRHSDDPAHAWLRGLVVQSARRAR